jgi:hypothetical protein
MRNCLPRLPKHKQASGPLEMYAHVCGRRAHLALPAKSVMDTQNKALALWRMDFCRGKRTAVLVAKKVADLR